MAKKFVKHLPKVGSAAVVAVAMSVALSTQVSATEYDETDLLTNPPVDETDASAGARDLAPAELNAEIDEANKETAADNQEVAQNNEQVQQDNEDVIDNNEEISGGELADPELEMPEAPEAPNTDGMDSADHNEAVSDYNEKVDDYNEAVGDYNDKVNDYNDAADAYDQAQQDKYEEELKQYEEDKKQHEDLQEQYKKDQEAYDQADAKYKAYEEALKKFKDAQAEFDKASENFQKESDIHEEVTEYNRAIKLGNLDIVNKNNALQNDLHADAAENIDEVGDANDGVTVEQTILDVLNTYDELAAQLEALQKQAAALETHAGKGADMSSTEYADYLAAVEAYNEKVAEYNEAAEAYNAAVDAYNEAVAAHNAYKDANPESSSNVGTTQGSGTTDWGNVNFDNYDGVLTHVDVKYNAAASKDVTIETDADGNKIGETVSDNISQYTVLGVYVDKNASETDPNKYGLNYSNDGWTTTKFQDLVKDNANDEFGNNSWTHVVSSLDPKNGQVRFYVTLRDAKGQTQGITVNLNAGSVYAKNSYYKAQFNQWSKETDYLDRYVGSNGEKIPVVYIDGEKYYDISGQSVFLISTLTCDGMTTNWWNDNLSAHGLDLILNLQTMIEIHKSANAEKIGYVEYQLGKTAQGQLSDAPTLDVDEPEKVDKPGDEPTKPDDFTLTPPTEPNKPGDEPVKPDDFTLTPPIEPNKPGEEPKDPGEFDKTEPEAPAPTERLEELGTLDKLTDKFIIVIPEPEPAPTPTPRPTPSTPSVEYPVMVIEEEEVPLAAQPVIEIEDEAVPLADTPETGDASLLWGLISSLSAGGFFALKRKRKED